MALLRKYQVLAKLEPQPGVLASSLLAAANAKILPIDPQLSIDVEAVDREIVRGTLTPATSTNGLEEATLTFGVELSGSVAGGATAVPVFDPLLRACGMQAKSIRAIGIGAISGGPFIHGEVVTGGTSSATAMVLTHTYTGQAVLRFVALTGTVATGEVLTGGTSGATATTAGSNAALGRAWYPVSSNRIQIDYTSGAAWSAGDLFQGDESGSILRALSSESGATGSDVEFEVLYGTLTNGETFDGIDGGTGQFDYSADTVSYEDMPTLSLAIVEDGVITTLRGCRGTVAIQAEIGKPIKMNFEFKGVVSSVTDGVAVTGVTYDTPVPPKFLGVDFQVAAIAGTYASEFTPRVTSFGLDLANTVAMRKDATDATGNLWAEITGRAPTVTMDPELLPEASFAWLGNLRSGDTARLRMSVGSSTSNRFKLFVPAFRVSSSGQSDREGFAVRDIQGAISGQLPDGTDGEDNEVVLTYEAVSATW